MSRNSTFQSPRIEGVTNIQQAMMAALICMAIMAVLMQTVVIQMFRISTPTMFRVGLPVFVVGLIAYPLGYVYIFRPLFERIMPKMHWLVGATIYGFGLFIVAIGIVAGPLLAGNPWFLNWNGITWVAMIGHTIYGIVCGYVVNLLEKHGIG